MRLSSSPIATSVLGASALVGVVLLVLETSGRVPQAPTKRGDASAPAAPTNAPKSTAARSRAVRPNVILLTIDTLRADALGSYGHPGNPTPTLDRLAQEGVRFTRAYATSSWTAPSVASLMTGLYPSHHGVTASCPSHAVEEPIRGQEELPPHLPLLVERLADAGYRTFGIVANRHLDLRLGFGRGFAQYKCVGFAKGPRVLAQLESWKDAITDPTSGKPYFLWLHLFDPHAPYFGFEPYLLTALADRPRFPDLDAVKPPDRYKQLQVTGDRLEYVRALYASEVHYADQIAGRMLTALGALEPNASTLVLVLSDHGEEFLDHGDFGHGNSLYEETVRVPLIVRLPTATGAGREVSVPVSLVDVLPTLSALLGLPPSEHAGTADGASFAAYLTDGRAPDPPSRPVLAELSRANPLRFIVRDQLKLIASPVSDAVELFDLAADPGEHISLHAQRASEAAALHARLLEALGSAEAPVPKVKPVSDRVIEALKSMGYVQ